MLAVDEGEQGDSQAAPLVVGLTIVQETAYTNLSDGATG